MQGNKNRKTRVHLEHLYGMPLNKMMYILYSFGFNDNRLAGTFHVSREAVRIWRNNYMSIFKELYRQECEIGIPNNKHLDKLFKLT